MIDFRFEWQEPPIKESPAAPTWGRLEIRSGVAQYQRVITHVEDLHARSTRDGVYGSHFALIDWMVTNWWSLLHESASDFGGDEPRVSARELWSDQRGRAWARRHSLLCVGGGESLPDLSIWRDGPMVRAAWVPDPEPVPPSSRVRFLSQGTAGALPDVAEDRLRAAVDAVMSRLDGNACQDACRLRENWNAINSADAAERRLCIAAAKTGLDPYCQDEWPVNLDAVIADAGDIASSPAGEDVLDAASGTGGVRLGEWFGWLRSRFPKHLATSIPAVGKIEEGTAYDHGYRGAELLRRQCGLSEDAVLPTLPAARPGPPTAAPDDTIDGMVYDDGGEPVFQATTKRDDMKRKFPAARALYHYHFSGAKESPRLVTDARTWEQRASRAFAAEILAPKAILRSKFSGRGHIPYNDVAKAAGELGVSPQLVVHQIQNHRIGWVA